MSEKKNLYKIGDPKDFLKRRAILSGVTSADATSALTNQKIKPAQLLRPTEKVSSKLKKATNVIRKISKKTPIGRALDTAVKVGAGIGAGYEYAKSKFKDKKEKVDKKATGGMADYIKDLIK